MIPYIINVALVLAGCLTFYMILLRKETFYRVNRYFLIICLLVSFGLPMLPVPQQWSLRKTDQPSSLYQSYKETSQPTSTTTNPVNSVAADEKDVTPIAMKSFSFENFMKWMVYLYWFGVIAFGINFLVQVIVLLYRSATRPVIIDGQFRIIEMTGDKAPCSFANNIFINPEKYEWETYNQIIQHEKVHIRQKHTLDILLAELMLVFQWFNPFAWRYRKEMETNLEYLTDDELVQRESVEKSSYQLSLLKVSTPHFPLSLTTNYNQSLLKKRIAMMNAKRSNVHTAWKYFFLLPLLVLFACLFNEPVALSQSTPTVENKKEHKGIETEGSWFATIKDDKIKIQFKKDDDDDNSYNGSTYNLSDFTNLPRGTTGTFKLTREAGTMEFTGKFEGDQGMGRYKFIADKDYGKFMSSELKETLTEHDQMVFFFINVKRSYLKMLKEEGYASVEKNELIPLVAIGVDQEYIRGLKAAGYKNVELQELIPLKSLGITQAYINEIKSSGVKDVTVNQLITFKAQGIDKEYITKVRKQRENDPNKKNDENDELDHIVTFKALKIDDEFINSFKSVGMTNIPNEQLIPMKALGITPEYIKGFQDMGYKDIEPEDLPGLKAQNVTPEFIKSFEPLGYKNVPLNEFVAIKAVGVTPEYVTTMKQKGFNYKSLQRYVSLKSVSESDNDDDK